MSASVQVANGLEQNVSPAIQEQTLTVTIYDKETERLEALARDLRDLLTRFKI